MRTIYWKQQWDRKTNSSSNNINTKVYKRWTIHSIDLITEKPLIIPDCAATLWDQEGTPFPSPEKWYVVVQNNFWVLAMSILTAAKINPVLSGARTLVLNFLVLYGQQQFMVFYYSEINRFLYSLLWSKLFQSFSKHAGTEDNAAVLFSAVLVQPWEVLLI